ncbi:hypothetical protein Q428_01395 [Fervidicella metallireducens AeB]|uniref:N-terminal cleavage protein n=1 Tax=Fervidicella metallireducens AeB TaxID=1403537 RepID=A0A017S0M5_9CLOT|nr:prepilin-type N-terminal cleavage/methylation domain-containing protein [Fervidicella metallireducens]EYE89735.1 hypothetical protein Q428_01395 [Fervidicella metallireducens AeB]
MKRKSGITLVELIIAIFLLSIIAAVTFDFIFTNYRFYLLYSFKADENQNVRIAVEYLSKGITNAKEVKLIKKINNREFTAQEIVAEDKEGNYSQYVYLDDKKIYLLNGIIRCDTSSQHVVSGIKSFEIKDKGRGLYTITVNGKEYSQSTNIFKGK